MSTRTTDDVLAALARFTDAPEAWHLKAADPPLLRVSDSPGLVRGTLNGMGYRVEITGPVRGVLKPNWLVAGRNREFAARMLVDGLDGTHYVISAQAL